MKNLAGVFRGIPLSVKYRIFHRSIFRKATSFPADRRSISETTRCVFIPFFSTCTSRSLLPARTVWFHRVNGAPLEMSVLNVIEALTHGVEGRDTGLTAFPVDHLHPLGRTHRVTVVEPLADMLVQELFHRCLHLFLRELLC